ncbi:MAG: hypothetical protein DMF71_09065 [Acidobacteria bacterium]|nr:MAG: hypothetical protein DMF71_09065 [Acidobacteriota bacterium]
MNQVKCPGCGLSNPAKNRECVRCYTSLPGFAGFEPQSTEHNLAASPKILMAICIGTTVLIMLAVAAVPVYKLTSRALTPGKMFEPALKDALLRNTARVDVARYTYYNNRTNWLDQEATPAARSLSHLGLIDIRESVSVDSSSTMNETGAGFMVVQSRHVDLKPTAAGQLQISSWEAYENKEARKAGWYVPIGERELVGTVDMMPIPEGKPLQDAAIVSFKWRWKPNQLGKTFDKSSPSYFPSAKSKNLSRDPTDIEIDDSQVTYWGTAEMARVNGVWEAKRLFWFGPNGVQLSPNMTDELNRTIEKTQGK